MLQERMFSVFKPQTNEYIYIWWANEEKNLKIFLYRLWLDKLVMCLVPKLQILLSLQSLDNKNLNYGNLLRLPVLLIFTDKKIWLVYIW